MRSEEVKARLEQYLVDELECEEIDGRVACSLPLEYSDGDLVVVYVTSRNGELEITDYGEGVRMGAVRPGVRMRSIAPLARKICADLGVDFVDGRVIAQTSPPNAADVAWRIGLASARISDVLVAQRPEPAREEVLFVEEVETALRERRVQVAREHRLIGASGHQYRATLYLPESQAVLEPLGAEASWNLAASIYVEFGDLARADGYHPVSVLDDRAGEPHEDLLNLLIQVGYIVHWSRREEWLASLLEGRSDIAD